MALCLPDGYGEVSRLMRVPIAYFDAAVARQQLITPTHPLRPLKMSDSTELFPSDLIRLPPAPSRMKIDPETGLGDGFKIAE